MEKHETNPPETCGQCPPGTEPQGPVREAGGTTGAGNLSSQQANRTGGATSGVPQKEAQQAFKPDDLEPST